jgi:2-methylcitrate dehydratase PrpD
MTTGTEGAGVPALTRYVADFVVGTREEDIPAEVQQLGRKAILDALGVALPGAISAPGRVLAGYLADLGRPGPATVLGTALKLAPRFAALANGTAMHADDYDDTLQAETGRFQGVHPTAPVLSAVLAAGEARGVSGRQLLLAYQVGVEVACRLFDATHVNHILHGFHATATCGMLGAAAAVARLYGMDADGVATTLGIAASQAGGLQENFGTSVKPFHAGRSAEVGIVAADLQMRGFTASPIILEAKRGFFQALGGGYEAGRLVGKLGQPWSFVDRGIWLKPFPTGSLGHPAMTKMLDLVTRYDIRPDQVRQVKVKTSENIHHTLLHHRPTTELQAKFSLEFCLAALLLERKCGLNQFHDAYVMRPDVQAAIAKVEYTTFDADEARRDGHTIVTAYVEIVLNDGRRHGERIDFGKGNKANPMSEDEVADKFRECAQFSAWPEDKTEQVIGLVRRLEEVDDVRAITTALASAPGA